MCFHGETEREKLERAIKRLEAREWCDDAKLALAAARRHLDTLPKPKRKVKVQAWALIVNGEVVGVTKEPTMRRAWFDGLVSNDKLIPLTGEYEE